MKNIRTILLLSATCLTIIGAETSFASLNGASLPSYTGSSATSTSICNTVTLSPKSNQKSHTHLVAESPSPHLSSLNSLQTQSEHRDLFIPISLALTDAGGGSPLKLPQLASVCFITEAGNCAGLETDDSWDLNNEDRCKEEGYSCTPCPGASTPIDICPYDNDCHRFCESTCDSAYNKSCNGFDEAGKGDSCDGLYKECCSLCSDYPYTDSDLPTGYIKGESCTSCTGIKYKASCDKSYKYTCSGNHISGWSGTACDGKYKSCKCQSGYGWNSSTGTCDISCDTAYQFDCIKSSVTHISGGDGSACDGKYQRCTCTSPYTWSSNACTCPSTYKYACTGTGYSGGSGTACNGKYTKCTCASGYEWKNGTCTKTCDSSYLYTCTNLNETGGSGDYCNNKYKSCTCKSGYIWNQNQCIKDCSECNIGCIYFSDKSCSSIKESGKTPLGVVAYKNGSNMQIIALNSIRTGKDWSTEDSSLLNIKLSLFDTEEKAQTDFDSCGNTSAIIAAGDSSTFPGVYAAYNYRPSGTPSGQNWCLPAAGVLASIRDNITIINDALKTAGGATMGKEGTSLNWYWSSTLQDRNNMSIGGLRLVWVYTANASDNPDFNKLDTNIANSKSTSSTDENFRFRSVLDVSSCSSSYKYTCTGTGYSGGYGTACGGKYTKCTCKSGYTWEGYYGTCEKACGPEFQYTCPTYNGIITGGVGSPCDNKYTACTCTSGYTWDSNSGDCEEDTPTCDSSYMYTCTYSSSTHISGGSGTPCNGKYTACQCSSGYVWDYTLGQCKAIQSCDSSYKYTCTYSSSTHISGGNEVNCGRKYKSCQCMSGYTWDSSSGTCIQNTSTCSSEYKYSCITNSYNHITGGNGSPCNKLYKSCNCEGNFTWNSTYGNCESQPVESSFITVCFSYKTSGVLLFNGQTTNRTNWTSGCHKIFSPWCLDYLSAERDGSYTITWENDAGSEIKSITVYTNSCYGGKEFCLIDDIERPCLSDDELSNPNGNFQVIVE